KADEHEDVTPECHTKDAPANTQKSINNTLDTGIAESVDKKEAVKNVEEVKANIKRGLRDKMPAYLYDIMAPYFDLDDLYRAYGTLLRGKASIDKTIMFESNEGLFTDAVLSVINAYKRGVVHNLFAVLFTAAQDTAAQIYRQQNYVVPHWLQW
ncbi:hypothetical protein ACFQ38_11430, partial [Sporosarcina contaminans]